MAEPRSITVKIEGLDKLVEAIEQLKQVEVNVEKIARAINGAARSASPMSVQRPRRLSDPLSDEVN